MAGKGAPRISSQGRMDAPTFQNTANLYLALYTLHTNISNHQGIPQCAFGKVNIKSIYIPAHPPNYPPNSAQAYVMARLYDMEAPT